MTSYLDGESALDPGRPPSECRRIKGVATVLSLGVIGWIIIGGLAGWIGSKIMKTDQQMGIMLNIVVGIVVGLPGGFLLRVLGVQASCDRVAVA